MDGPHCNIAASSAPPRFCGNTQTGCKDLMSTGAGIAYTATHILHVGRANPKMNALTKISMKRSEVRGDHLHRVDCKKHQTRQTFAN